MAEQTDDQAQHNQVTQGTATVEPNGTSDGKQVVAPNGLYPAYEEKQFLPAKNQGSESQYKSLAPPVAIPDRGRRRTRLITLGIMIAIIVVVVSVPTGVEVSKNKRRKSVDGSNSANATVNAPVNTTVTPSPVTSNLQGNILKGTRLSTMDPWTGGDIYLFYQWDDRSLHYIAQNAERVWQGSTDLHVTNAKLGTPLASVGTFYNDCWWLFFVDDTNVIQNIYSKKDATTWHRGNIGTQNYKVPNSTNIAFTVSRGRIYNQTLNDLDSGLSLYASNENGVIQEYIYDDQDESWSNGFTFPNTDGLSSASTWSEGPSAFIFTSRSDQSLELWYRDYNSTSADEDNRWKLGPSSQASLMPNGSICGQHGIAFQGTSGAIRGSNFSEFSDPTQTRWATTYEINNQAAISGSAVSCWYFYPHKRTNPNIMNQVFYQTEGNGIQEAIRTWAADNMTVPGTWTYSAVPVKAAVPL